MLKFNYGDLFEYPESNLAKTEKQPWLEQVASFVNSAKSWAHYHIHQECSSLSMSKILTFDMQVQTMNLNIKAISPLNPRQTSVDVSDCPVCALTKEASYQFPKHF